MKLLKHTKSYESGRRLLLTSVTALAVAWPGAVAVAQDAGDASEEEEARELNVITVTARRRDENLQEIPDQVNVFTAETIEDAGIENLEDLALLSPGVFFSGDFFTASNVVTMRGSSQSNGQSAPISFTIDGVTLPNAVLFSQPLFDIQQTEVLRGPQGALYGRNSLGGAINITTKAPTNEFESSVKAHYAEGEDYGISGTISGPIIEDVLLYRLTGSFEDREGLFTSALGHNVDDRTASFGRLKVLFMPTPNLEFDWRIAAHREDRHPLRFQAFNVAGLQPSSTLYTGLCAFPYRGGVSTTGDPCPVDDLPAEGILQQPDVPDAYNDWESYTQKVTWDLEGFSLTSITDYTDSRQGGFAWLGYARTEFLPAAILPDNSESFTQEFRITSTDDSGPLQWSGGLFFQNLKREQAVTLASPDFTTTLTGGPLGSGNETEEESFGVFGQVDYDLTDALTLTVAGRYDTVDFSNPAIAAPLVSSETFDAFQPKVSLSYQLASDKLIYATYSQAFRPGVINASDLATPGDNVIDDENLTNYELGFKSSWANRTVILNGAVYYLDIEDWQYFTFAVDPATSAAQRQLLSAPKANTFGAELELQWYPTENLDFTAGWTLTDTEVEEYDGRITTVALDGSNVPATAFNGASFLYVPENTFNLSGQYTQPVTSDIDMVARVDFIHRGEYFFGIDNADTFGERQKPYSITNLRLGFETNDWRITGFVNNAGDTDYAVHAWVGRHVGLPNSALTPGRTQQWGIEAEYNF